MNPIGKISNELCLAVTKYRAGGSPCVAIVDRHGDVFGILSINLYGHPDTDLIGLEDDEFVLNHDFLSGIGKQYVGMAVRSGLVSNTGKTCGYGFCNDIPIMRITVSGGQDG